MSLKQENWMNNNGTSQSGTKERKYSHISFLETRLRNINADSTLEYST